MKNTIIIDLDNDGKCDCIDSVYDGTQRLFIEARSNLYPNPIFNILADEISQNIEFENNENMFLMEIPSIFLYDHQQFTFNVGGIKEVITLYFLCNSLERNGNLILKQQTENGYLLRTFVKNTTGIPIATRSSLGVVRVGDGLSIEGDGNLTSNGGNTEAITQADLDRILI